MTPLHLRARLRSALFALSERPASVHTPTSTPDNVMPFPVVRTRSVSLTWREGPPTPAGQPEEVVIDLDRAGRLHPRALASRLRDAADRLDAQADAEVIAAAEVGERARGAK